VYEVSLIQMTEKWLGLSRLTGSSSNIAP